MGGVEDGRRLGVGMVRKKEEMVLREGGLQIVGHRVSAILNRK